jgi:hypothetical protein
VVGVDLVHVEALEPPGDDPVVLEVHPAVPAPVQEAPGLVEVDVASEQHAGLPALEGPRRMGLDAAGEGLE